MGSVDNPNQHLGGGRDPDRGDGVGVDLHRHGSLHSYWCSNVDVMVGNGGNLGVYGST